MKAAGICLRLFYCTETVYLHKIKKGGDGMRRRCNGAPTEWLCGLLLIAVGGGMLLACLIPKCVYLVGIGLIGLGCWLVKK